MGIMGTGYRHYAGIVLIIQTTLIASSYRHTVFVFVGVYEDPVPGAPEIPCPRK